MAFPFHSFTGVAFYEGLAHLKKYLISSKWIINAICWQLYFLFCRRLTYDASLSSDGPVGELITPLKVDSRHPDGDADPDADAEALVPMRPQLTQLFNWIEAINTWSRTTTAAQNENASGMKNGHGQEHSLNNFN